MKIFTKILSVVTLLGAILILSQGCKDPMQTDQIDDQFDRSEMLTDWADKIIIPSYTDYVQSLELLVEANTIFSTTKNSSTLSTLREYYLNAYKAWQVVSMFEIGKAEEVQIRNFTNIYPTDVDAILENISSEEVNLELPSNYDTQGFPAIDYLLFGLSSDDVDLMTQLDGEAGAYLTVLVDRLYTLSQVVLSDWNDGYRETFIDNDGSSATASVDKVVNDYLFYYEKFLRASKIGLPAGVFTGSELPRLVEAPYSRIYSKELLMHGFQASRDFFNGTASHGQSDAVSLSHYLDYIFESNAMPNVSSSIHTQWDVIETAISLLQDDLYSQVEEDNSVMLAAYDELQKNVIALKVDMMQALNIQVDYVDADGD